ncbi:DUF3013 family protein [Allofustis seminis]|uniref:DUF3013 family protein n=1 Tax=Allofustis seminis TaxID=166939 RepID=UPI00036EF1AB|nr:DUF3013 family protein [Allofustis seminis]
MKKLSDYLSEQLKMRASFFDWKIIVDSQKQIIFIKLHVTAENERGIYIQDEYGQISNDKIIHYEQAICFYNEELPLPDPKHYLFSYPINVHVGIEVGVVDAILKHLVLFAHEVALQLKEFINDGKSNIFLPHWNMVDFENTIQTLKDLKHYCMERLAADFDYEPTSIEKLRGDMHGVVERI